MYPFVSLVLFGGFYYLVPLLTRRLWPLPWLVSAHYWLVVVGFAVYFVSLTVGGWLQGMAMLDGTRDFLESLELTVPYLTGRSVGGALMTAGHVVFALNLVTIFVAERRPRALPAAAAPAE